MERIDSVTLTDEKSLTKKDPRRKQSKIQVEITEKPYPDHEELGRFILEKRQDLIKAIGSKERAQHIGQLFSRAEATNQQLSKLIHSSLDMDRLDYLLRDARAAGVPYGEIDLNYLLNNTRISPEGFVGVEQKALAAAEHFLIARMFMYRTLYYHKTTYAFEEACRQLLRRIKDASKYDMPQSGTEIEELITSDSFSDFNDGFVDLRIRQAAQDSDPVTKALAQTILDRKAPRLLAEVTGLEDKTERHNQPAMFKLECKSKLPDLSKKFDVPLGQFLCCGPKPVKFEERSSHFDIHEAKNLKKEEREELIKVFWNGETEPRSIVDIPHSLASYCSQRLYGINRLYVVGQSIKEGRYQEMKAEVASWDSMKESKAG